MFLSSIINRNQNIQNNKIRSIYQSPIPPKKAAVPSDPLIRYGSSSHWFTNPFPLIPVYYSFPSDILFQLFQFLQRIRNQLIHIFRILVHRQLAGQHLDQLISQIILNRAGKRLVAPLCTRLRSGSCQLLREDREEFFSVFIVQTLVALNLR